LLIRYDPDGLAAGELARLLSVTPSLLSAHLTVLTRSHLVTSQRRSRSIIYRARLDRLEMLLQFLVQDCCSGRPDIRARVMESVTRRLSARTKGH
jgi:ArsR family transcriptional regulator